MKKVQLDEERAVEGATQMLQSLGFDLTDKNYEGTPARLVEVLRDFSKVIRGENSDALDGYFNVVFPKHNGRRIEYRGMLVQSPIRVYSLCSHHLLPIIYDISFAYLPAKNEQIGFSKIIRILRELAKRPMNQEDFTQEAADVFFARLKPKGLAIIVSGVHMCMKMRGVKSDAVNKTSVVKGEFKEFERTRDEFLALATNFNHQI